MISLKNMLNQRVMEETGAAKKLNIDGNVQDTYKVIKIPLQYLYYNDQNGRINTAYKKYIALHPERMLKPENDESSQFYNKTFEKFIYESNKGAMLSTKKSIKRTGQQEPGVVLDDGRVIDGNRRFTALRMIQEETNTPQYFEAVILSFDISVEIDARKIKKLELDLQMGREERVDYDPIDRVFSVYDTCVVRKTLTPQEYATSIGKRNASSVNKDIDEAKLIIEYLEFIHAPKDAYYLARDLKLDGPMHEVLNMMRKYRGEDREEIRDSIFAVLANDYVNLGGSGSGDTSRNIRKLIKNVLDTPIKRDFLEKADDYVDDVFQALKVQAKKSPAKKIESAADLSSALTNNKKIVESSEELKRITNLMVRRGSMDADRQESVNTIKDCVDNLSQVSDADLQNLNTDEWMKAQESIADLGKIVEHLKGINRDV